MKYSEAKHGRVFILRLEDGDVVHETIERFAHEHGSHAAALIAVGGADEGSRFVVGPETGRGKDVNPLEHVLTGVHEVAGTGTLFPNEKGEMIIHMHMAAGRRDQTVTGCIRKGVKVWHVLEVILFELLDSTAVRRFEPATGFELMQPR